MLLVWVVSLGAKIYNIFPVCIIGRLIAFFSVTRSFKKPSQHFCIEGGFHYSNPLHLVRSSNKMSGKEQCTLLNGK